MKYFVLLAGYGEMAPWEKSTEEEQAAQMEALQAFSEACEARPGVAVLAEEALSDGSMATTLRTRGGELTITDGPFAEAAEQIGGFYLIDAPDLDTVIELCRVLPAYDIDIRPVPDMS
ncbi:MAG: YciI family protein [Acidimicrobiales bacterium]